MQHCKALNKNYCSNYMWNGKESEQGACLLLPFTFSGLVTLSPVAEKKEAAEHIADSK